MNSIIQKKNEIIKIFANEQGLRILDFEFLISQRKKNCCLEVERLLVYQKEDRSLGKIKFCCEKKLINETQRISKFFQKARRNDSQIYKVSYKSIRGSVGQILLQTSFGINIRIYVRENELIKKHSILRNINYLLESCEIEKWNFAIENFQRTPNKKSIEEIIKLYSPLFRNDNLLISRMAEELIIFLENIFKRWKENKKRIVYCHLGVGIVIDDTLVNFKFTEYTLGLHKTHFEHLYRSYRSICRSNPLEKEKIRKLAIFSPITNQLIKLEIREAVAKWELARDFNRNFTLWQLKNYISISKNNIFIADNIEQSAELAIETGNPFFKKLGIIQKNEE